MAGTQGRLLLPKEHKHTAAQGAPLQYIQVSVRPQRAGRLLLTSPLPKFKAVVYSCPASRTIVPWASMLARPLQEAQMSMMSSCTADA